MRRREFVAMIAGAAVATAARAQQRVRRLAFVHSGIPADKLTESAGPFWVRKVFQELRELGYVEGKTLIVERFSAEGRADRYASLASEVVSRNPDVVIVNLPDLIKQFTTATSKIPLVTITGDPIAAGLVTNLARPGGNLTGVSINAGLGIYGKRIQIVKEAIPATAKVVTLRSGPPPGGMSEFHDAARQLGIDLILKQLSEVNEDELGRTFAELATQQFDAALVDESGSFLAQRGWIAKLAEKHRVPVMYPYRDYVEEGGLMAYTPDFSELAREIAREVHQILNGTKAGDIPFYQPNMFRLVINVKAAKSIGLDLPPSLLARADEVIE